ncbi:MAG: DUF1622 domain-containing protein [Methanomassiliicoccales archaeon]|nr:MAG: DUF1622 domain-containing protein [Methanomassiliicoccales archaeon]
MSFFFSVIGVATVSFGGARAIYQIFERWTKKQAIDVHGVKVGFVQLIILGLDFFIAADILMSFIAPTLDDLVLLGTVVGIRTVLSFFLSRETKE